MFFDGTLAAAGVAALMTAAFPTHGKTLIFCSEGSPEGFNPQLYTAGTTFNASSRQIYNRLVEFERGTTETVPALAESWTVSDDGVVYTFRLRRGVKWHETPWFKPTRDFNADDVVFSFDRQLRKDHPYHKVSGGSYEYFNGMDMPNLLKSVEKIDDHTVRFTLNQPEAPFIADLGMDFASILSAEYADRMLAAGTPEKVNLEPVGTGPFQFVNYQKDAVIRYRAHRGHFRGKAAIDNLTAILAADLGPSGVRVNAVVPGYVRSEQMQARIDAGLRDPAMMNAQSAFGRMVKPSEVAAGVWFLCSGDAAAITGAALPIDAGWLARSTYIQHPGWKPET